MNGPSGRIIVIAYAIPLTVLRQRPATSAESSATTPWGGLGRGPLGNHRDETTAWGRGPTFRSSSSSRGASMT